MTSSITASGSVNSSFSLAGFLISSSRPPAQMSKHLLKKSYHMSSQRWRYSRSVEPSARAYWHEASFVKASSKKGITIVKSEDRRGRMCFSMQTRWRGRIWKKSESQSTFWMFVISLSRMDISEKGREELTKSRSTLKDLAVAHRGRSTRI